MRSPPARCTWKGEDLLAMEPSERAATGVFLAFQYPMEIPGVATMTFLRTAVNAHAQSARRGRAVDARLHALRAREGAGAQDRSRNAEAPAQCRLLRRREEAQRNPANGAAGALALRAGRDRFRSRYRRAACRRRGRERAALARPGDARHHPLPAPLELHRARPRACAVARAGWRARAVRSLRSSSKNRATPSSARQRRKEAVMDLPVQQFTTKAEQGYLDLFETARECASRRTRSLRLGLEGDGHRDLRPASACPIAASRPGNIPTSARGSPA